MKCRTCKVDLSDDDKFCFKCGTTVSESTMFVLCGGRKADGTQCDAELKESYRFCRQCGTKVDKSLFQKKLTPCQGKKDDGSVCSNLLEEDDKFCMECGTNQLTVPVSSPEEARDSSSNKDVANNLLSTDTTGLAPGCTPVFGSSAKLDGENVQVVNTENALAPRFPSSLTTIPSGNVSVSIFNVSQEGDTSKEENAGQSHLPSYSFSQSSSVAGGFRVSNMESQLDHESTGQSPSSGSSDSVTFHDNDLDNEHEEEKVNLSPNVESASRNSTELESKLNNVNLSEEKDDDHEDLSGDNIDDENESYEDNRCSDDSSPDSSDTESAEDEATKMKLPHEQRTERSKRKKKPMKYKKKWEKKKKMMEIKKNVLSSKSSEQLQEPQKEMESDTNRNVKHPAIGLDSDLQHIEVDEASEVAVGSSRLTVDSTNQMETNESKTPNQSGESDSAIAVEERYKENTNRDQIQDKNANLDRVPIQESGIKQDSQMDKVTKDFKELKSWAKVVQEGNNQHDAKKSAEQLNKKEDVDSMETDEHVSADMINMTSTGKSYSEHTNSDKSKTRSGTVSTDPKLAENDKKMGKVTGDSGGAKMTQDEKTQKTSKDAKNDSSQNSSSKDSASGEKSAGKNTIPRDTSPYLMLTDCL